MYPLAKSGQNEVEVRRDQCGRQWVRGSNCQFTLGQKFYFGRPHWIIQSYCRPFGINGDGYVAGVYAILEGRENWLSWPESQFDFVRTHIADAMLRDGFSAHDAVAVVQAMNETRVRIADGENRGPLHKDRIVRQTGEGITIGL